jgi:DNA-nicking Smr family endonuclease
LRFFMKLEDLKTIQVELKERLAREAEAARLAKEAALQAKRDMASSHDLFMRAIGSVTPLAKSSPTKTTNLLSDDFEVAHLLENGNYRRAGVGVDVIKRLQRGDWRIQSACDLHHLTSDEARAVQGFGSAGGTPVLKTKVQSWLVQMEGVTAFVQAKPEQGGAGALVVLIG